MSPHPTLSEEEIQERLRTIKSAAGQGLTVTFPHPLSNPNFLFDCGPTPRAFNLLPNPVIWNQGGSWLNPYQELQDLGVVEPIAPNFLRAVTGGVQETPLPPKEEKKEHVKKSKKFKKGKTIVTNALPIMN